MTANKVLKLELPLCDGKDPNFSALLPRFGFTENGAKRDQEQKERVRRLFKLDEDNVDDEDTLADPILRLPVSINSLEPALSGMPLFGHATPPPPRMRSLHVTPSA